MPPVNCGGWEAKLVINHTVTSPKGEKHKATFEVEIPFVERFKDFPQYIKDLVNGDEYD